MTRPLRVLPHAAANMLARGVSFDEVDLAHSKPDLALRQHTNETRATRGNLTIITAPDRYDDGIDVLVTVLWNVSHRWTSAEMKRHRRPIA